MRGIVFGAVLFCAGLLATSTSQAQNDLYYAAQPYGVYATRAAYGYGYYRPYGTYYGPGYYSYSYTYGAFPSVATYPPGYLPPRYYGGVGYWGGRGSSYYYGGGLHRTYRGR